MRSELYVIAKTIETLTGLKCNIMPTFQVKNEPELVIKPKSLIKILKGKDKGHEKYYDVTNELYFELILKCKGKDEQMLFSFYEANKACNEAFKYRNIPIEFTKNSGSNFGNGRIMLDKRINGGDYWTTEEENENSEAFVLSEIWDCVYNNKSYK